MARHFWNIDTCHFIIYIYIFCTFMCRIFPCGHHRVVGFPVSGVLVWSSCPLLSFSIPLCFLPSVHPPPTFFHNCSTYGALLSSLAWDSTGVQNAETNKPWLTFSHPELRVKKSRIPANLMGKYLIRKHWDLVPGTEEKTHGCTETVSCTYIEWMFKSLKWTFCKWQHLAQRTYPAQIVSEYIIKIEDMLLNERVHNWYCIFPLNYKK